MTISIIVERVLNILRDNEAKFNGVEPKLIVELIQ